MTSKRDASSSNAAATLLALIDELVAELRPGSRVRAAPGSLLDRDLGLDSLSKVELLARIERTFSVRLPDDVLANAGTPADLLDAVARGSPFSRKEGGGQPQVDTAPATTGFPERTRDLGEMLQWHVDRHPERVHVTFYRTPDDTATLTYADLAESAAVVAGSLTRAGVVPGQCVALMLPSGLDFFRCFFGILLAGAIPVPMYPPARPAQIEDHLRRQAGILRNCRAPVLIAFDAVRPILHLLRGLAPDLSTVTTPQELIQGDPLARAPARHDDVALVQYTSGSTGDPKGVVLTHDNLLANIRAWGHAIALTSGDVGVSWLPLYHDMGLIGAWLGSLYHACPLVLMSPLDFLARPERWLWAIHRHRGTVTAAPNFAFELCLKRLPECDLAGLDLSSWRFAANGAEPVNPDTLERFADAFARFGLRSGVLAPVYGLAECSVGLAVSPPGRAPRIDRIEREAFATQRRARPVDGGTQPLRFVSCGPPLPGHEVRIVGDHDQALPERHIGRLEFRGPSATSGYYRNAAGSAALFHGDWLDSGDFAYVADGEIYITGREKDMIIRGGRNFYPYELEQAVGALPGIRKGCVAAFGVTEPRSSSEQLIIVAETKERDAERRNALERHIIALGTDVLGLPPDVVVLAPPHAVLKTSSGKIRRGEIRERYRSGTIGAASRKPWMQLARLAVAGFATRCAGGVSRMPDRLYGAFVWILLGILGPPAVLVAHLVPDAERRWQAVRALARLCGRLVACGPDAAGLELMPAGPCVLVANHTSYADGIALMAALPRPVAFVGKAELARIPVLGGLLGRIGVHFVERSDSRRSAEDAEALAAGAADRWPLFFFAEGTFGRQPGLRPFRLGAFQAAAHAQLPVVPVVLKGVREFLPEGRWLPRRRRISVTMCPPVRAEGDGWHDVLALRDRVREVILAQCGERSIER